MDPDHRFADINNVCGIIHYLEDERKGRRKEKNILHKEPRSFYF